MADKTWLGGIGTFGYDNGTNEPAVGDVLTGAGGAVGTLVSLTQAGAWDGSAAGILTLRTISGTFVENEVITNTTQTETMADVDLAGTAFTDSAGSFAIADNWLPSGVPANADEIFANGLAETVPAGFSGASTQTIGKKFSIDAGLDQVAKNFASITVSTGFTGNIGFVAAGIYNLLLCACGNVVFSGKGSFYLAASHATELIDRVTNSASGGSLFLGKAESNGQAITQVINAGSTIQILGAQTGSLAAPEVNEVISVSSQGSVTIAEDNSSATLKITAVNGTVTAYCSIADLEVAGGTVQWGFDNFEPAAARTITLMNLLQGNVIWDMAGTISECYCYDGKFSVSGDGAKVLGAAAKNNGTIEVYDAKVSFDNAENNLTLAAEAEFVRFGGGSLTLPRNTEIVYA